MKQKSQTVQKPSFFSRIFDLLVGHPLSGEQEKLLVPLNRQLSRQGYKFFNIKKDKFLVPGLSLVYQAYTAAAPLHEFFMQKNDDAYYKNQVLRYSFSENQRRIHDLLQPEAIREASKTKSLKDIAEKYKEEFVTLRSEFNSQTISVVNNLYNSVMVLKQFCVLDYYAALRLADSKLKENDFIMAPRFSAIPRKYVADFLVDFFSSASLLLNIADWVPTFDFLRQLPGYKENDEAFSVKIPQNVAANNGEETQAKKFDSLLLLFRSLSDRELLPVLAKLSRRDFSYELPTHLGGKDIVGPYLDTTYQEFRETMQSLVQERKIAQIQNYMSHVFEIGEVKPLKFYNDEESSQYERKNVVGFLFCNGLMYVNAFFEKYLHGEISKFLDIFDGLARVRDKSTCSECLVLYHDLLDLHKELLKFDQRLDVKFPEGYQLKSMLEKCRGEENITAKLNMEVEKTNTSAKSIIRRSKEKLIAIQEIFALFTKDCQKATPKLVENWGEFSRRIKPDVATTLGNISHHIKYFVLLLDTQVKVS